MNALERILAASREAHLQQREAARAGRPCPQGQARRDRKPRRAAPLATPAQIAPAPVTVATPAPKTDEAPAIARALAVLRAEIAPPPALPEEPAAIDERELDRQAAMKKFTAALKRRQNAPAVRQFPRRTFAADFSSQEATADYVRDFCTVNNLIK
jgi:hypothetical protein